MSLVSGVSAVRYGCCVLQPAVYVIFIYWLVADLILMCTLCSLVLKIIREEHARCVAILYLLLLLF